jgi:hypothetical protein
MNLREDLNRIKEVMGVINENNEYYDKILDLYSEVGLDGMSEDEVDYLKSGGETELPNRFKEEDVQQEYNDFAGGEPEKRQKLRIEDWENIYALQRLIDKSESEVYIENSYDGVGFFMDVMCNIVFDDTEKNAKVLSKLNDPFNTEVKDGKIYYAIPKTYVKQLKGLAGSGEDDDLETY